MNKEKKSRMMRIRLTPTLWDRLAALSKEHDIPISRVARRLMEAGLEMPDREIEYELRVERLCERVASLEALLEKEGR